jgi:hypothetical protein
MRIQKNFHLSSLLILGCKRHSFWLKHMSHTSVPFHENLEITQVSWTVTSSLSPIGVFFNICSVGQHLKWNTLRKNHHALQKGKMCTRDELKERILPINVLLACFTIVTPRFKGKSECIEYMCARIKLHTCIDSLNTKNSVKMYREYKNIVTNWMSQNHIKSEY